jgi:hypothetical protein
VDQLIVHDRPQALDVLIELRPYVRERQRRVRRGRDLSFDPAHLPLAIGREVNDAPCGQDVLVCGGHGLTAGTVLVESEGDVLRDDGVGVRLDEDNLHRGGDRPAAGAAGGGRDGRVLVIDHIA